MTPTEAELSKKLLNTQEKLINFYAELSDLRRRVLALETAGAKTRCAASPNMVYVCTNGLRVAFTTQETS